MGNGRRKDRKNAKNVNPEFIPCSSGDEIQFDGDEGLHGTCKECIKRMSSAYVRNK